MSQENVEVVRPRAILWRKLRSRRVSSPAQPGNQHAPEPSDAERAERGSAERN